MKRNHLLALASLVLALACGTAAWAASPSLHEVYQAAERGDLKRAEGMMDQVLSEHPNSAKAHFVYAELLARQGRVDMARAELGTAERLAPGLPFADAGAVAALRNRVGNSKAHAVAPAATLAPAAVAPLAAAPAARDEFPWGMVAIGVLLLAAIVFFVRSLNRSRAVAAMPNTAYAPASGGGGGFGQSYGYGPAGVPPAAPSGGMGSGILGGLATGAAVGAGIVAGQALMHRVLDGGSHHDDARTPLQTADSFAPPAADYDMGGNDFGVADSGSWDDAGGGGGDDWS